MKNTHFKFLAGKSIHHKFFKKGNRVDTAMIIEILLIIERDTSINQEKEIIKLIANFAEDYELKITETNLIKRIVRLTGTTAQIEKAFKFDLHHYHGECGKYYAHETHYFLPKTLEGKIIAVLGLDNLPIFVRPQSIQANNTDADTSSENFTAPELVKLYNFPHKFDGSGNTIGIIELGGGFKQNDLNIYFQKFNQSPPTPKVILVGNATNDPSDTGLSQEVLLDIQVVGSAAPGANLAVYFAENSKKGYVDAITSAVHNTDARPDILSMSWGSSESQWPAAIITAMEAILADAIKKNITVIASSGDAGSSNGGPGLNVNYPASSPQVLSCGGTTVSSNKGVIKKEVVWNAMDDFYIFETTGGGVSTHFNIPDWQNQANIPPIGDTNPAKKGRGVPDVSLNAQNYLFIQDGQNKYQSGTSAVVPMWAGLISRCNQATGKKLGFINKILYKIWQDTPSAFKDITSGQNGDNFYKARSGWDACTGLGSPKPDILISELKKINVSS